MPRQFFTLKSLLTAAPAPSGDTNGAGAGAPPNAVLEHPGGGNTPLDVHDNDVIEIDDGRAREDESSDEQNHPYEEQTDVARTPETDDDEVLFQDEPNYDDEVEISNAIPPHALAQMEQMQQQMHMMAQQLQFHEAQQRELAERPPEMPPPIARFANVVVYDGSFEPLQNQVGQILSEAINEVMRLRGRAAEAFERQTEEMLADLAMAVLGRELRTEPADIAALVAQMKARMGVESPLTIRVAPEDAQFIQGPVKADESLAYGDLVFEVDDGELDLRLGTRIAAVLRQQQVQL